MTTCDKCHGSGYIIMHPRVIKKVIGKETGATLKMMCTKCSGSGQVKNVH